MFIIDNKIDKYMYIFLKKFNGQLSINAENYFSTKFNLEENYINFIVKECIDNGYIIGTKYVISGNNFIHLIHQEHIFVTRKGFQFINQYELNKINIFWIPFKNLLIIFLTALFTALATYFFGQD